MTLAQLKRIEDGVWISNTKSIGEEVALLMPKRQEVQREVPEVQKVVICDSRGQGCADTYPASAALPRLRGLLVTTP
jgi:hypothetical protein